MMESGLVDHWKFKYQQAVEAEAASEKYYAERLAEALRKVEISERSWELTIADHQRTIQRATKLESDLDEAKQRIVELEACREYAARFFEAIIKTEGKYAVKQAQVALQGIGKEN